MNRARLEAAFRARVDSVEAAGAALRERTPGDIARSVVLAWRAIGDPELALGRAARERLPESTGLSLEMVAWGLSTALSEERLQELLDLAERLRPPEGMRFAPLRMSALFLSGNVFTACVEPWSVALMCRAPVLVKASTKDDVLPRLFHDALGEVDPDLAEATDVFSFPGGTTDLEATILSRADAVSVFGSDATLVSIRSRLTASSSFIAHGHGLGVAYVAREAILDASSVERVAAAIALDVAAYDQRGCMSPHAVFVERAERAEALRFLRELANALDRLAREVPRGGLPAETGTAQLQWRGVAAARGELLEGDGWAVSYEAGASFRLSPGHRNILVLDTAGPRAFASAVGSLGVHLKTVGVAGSDELRAAIAAALPPPLAPRICRAGHMQTPRYGGLSDGRRVEAGLYRLIDDG